MATTVRHTPDPHSALATAVPERRAQVKIYTASGRASTLDDLRALWQSRELLWMLAQRDIKVRYAQSWLGIAWAILQPLSLTLLSTLVFSLFLHVKTGQVAYPVFTYIAMLPWTFFANSLSFSSTSLINNSGLLTKVYFPREHFPIAAMGACLFDFLIGALIAAGMMLYYGIAPTAWLLALPVILAVQIALSGAIGMIMSAVVVFFRDLRFAIPLLTQLWLYATPVFYPATAVPARLRTVFALNPMVGLVDAYRQTVLYGRAPDWQLLGLTLLTSLILLFIGFRFFKWAELRFADVI
ncbi:MAG TPA: ABC transporter permease [Chloroflexota bacterium]|nr:ABC transporter permease [Chloroflexota bacterium]